MNRRRIQVFFGGLLIVIGLLLLLANIRLVSMAELWPVFVLACALAFWLGFFMNTKEYGLLMPAGVLTVVGLLFLYCALTGWDQMVYLWPVFLFAPALGFFLMYFLGPHESGLLVPGTILSICGVIFLSFTGWGGQLWPVLLILVGILLLFVKKKKPDQRSENNSRQ
ncbi:hypothetical protein ISS37_05950 [candidate division KSB1 bacterium]|nr:hypothetical protein [candidate division KSB1 bacterium]